MHVVKRYYLMFYTTTYNERPNQLLPIKNDFYSSVVSKLCNFLISYMRLIYIYESLSCYTFLEKA